MRDELDMAVGASMGDFSEPLDRRIKGINYKSNKCTRWGLLLLISWVRKRGEDYDWSGMVACRYKERGMELASDFWKTLEKSYLFLHTLETPFVWLFLPLSPSPIFSHSTQKSFFIPFSSQIQRRKSKFHSNKQMARLNSDIEWDQKRNCFFPFHSFFLSCTSKKITRLIQNPNIQFSPILVLLAP